MSDWMEAPTLMGKTLRLEALTAQHADEMFKHWDESTALYLSGAAPEAQTVEDLRKHFHEINARPERVNWAVVMHTGEVAGRISYGEVRLRHRRVEIGTMLTHPFRGTTANPEAKFLLLERAFEVLRVNRVQFQVDARNGRSLRAMEKLGAVQEGILRSHQLRKDGQVRNMVMFSLLPSEWPAVKASLQERLHDLMEGHQTEDRPHQR